MTQRGEGTEGSVESDDGRCVDPLRSQKKNKQSSPQEILRNIQTEGGPQKDQYIKGNKEEIEEEKEQIAAEDTSMTEGGSTAKEDEEEVGGKGTRMYSREGGGISENLKVKGDENRLMNFGPHRKRTYGEVLREKPGYVEFLIKGNQRDNHQARFAHWVMAFVVETFFSGEEEKQEEEVEEEEEEEDRLREIEEGRPVRYRRQTSA